MSQHTIGTYEILEELGSGGMGTVYRGVNIRTGADVAVKHLRPSVLKHDPGVLERFRREGEALRDLNHPNIVKMVDAIAHEGDHYLVMEYVAGGDLTRLLNDGGLPIQRILNIAIDLSDALTRAHRLQIIHRDLKPANVLIAADGTPRLTDFGVAHLGTKERVTASESVVGTIDYLPPEALNGGAADARSDIWSFGVMLFEMLAGQRPFRGTSYLQVMMSILQAPLPDLEALCPDAPVAVVDLVYRMLERDPQTRIASVRLVGAELEAIMHGRTTDPVSAGVHRGGPAPQAVARFATPTPSPLARRNNLPAQTTPFVGRESELAELSRLLDDTALRLITILAPGGMGKTRLSLEAAQRQVTAFANGVYFVELAPLSGTGDIVPALAEAISYQFQADGRSEEQQVLDFLSSKQALLVIDNWEHVIEGAPLVMKILNAAPGVQIMATSRQRLSQPGETVFHLSGMEFPEWGTPADALNYAATKLFMNSAVRARPGFELTADNLDDVARICRLAQGMPLGIVLAAAWLAVLTPAEIAAEIQQGIDFLEDEAGAVPERQRSIRAVFDYSWEQMTAEEQLVFMKMSVFRGGFTREAAHAVTGATLRGLMALVNKSLLRRENDTGRYHVHELLRQYAAEQLAASPQADEAAHEAHATYFADLMQDRWAHLKDQRFKAALDEIASDMENVRTAWRYWVKHDQARQLQRFTDSYWIVCEVQSWFQPAINLLQEATFPDGEDQPEEVAAARAHIQAVQAWFKSLLGLPDQGLPLAKASVATLQRRNRSSELFVPLSSININAIFLNQREAVEQASQTMLTVARGNNDPFEEAFANGWLAYAAVGRQPMAEVQRLAAESLKVFDALANPFGLSVMHGIILGGIAMLQSDFAAASHHFQRGLDAAESVGYQRVMQLAYDSLGNLALFQQALPDAQSCFLKSLRITEESGQVREMLGTLRDIARVRQLQREHETAVELLAVVLGHPANTQNSLFRQENLRDEADKMRAELEQSLPPERYAVAWARGQSLDLETVVQETLAESTG